MSRMMTSLLVALGVVVGAQGDVAAENWPAWRGPAANGLVPSGDPPIEWSEKKNIKWKVALPGSGSSTPAIWGDKILLTTAVQMGEEPQVEDRRRDRGVPKVPTVTYRFNIVCLARETGEVLWERTAIEAVPHEGHHPTGSYASYSPVTDGRYVWASFGSRGLHCYDLDGNRQWSADLLQMETPNSFGEGSSPILVGDAIIVVMDHEGASKIFAFNKTTGDLLWAKDRDERTSWATPLAVNVNGRTEVITLGADRIRSYDPRSGDIIWQSEGLEDDVIPSPVAGHGLLYCATGYLQPKLRAIELGRTGDLSGSDAIKWEINRDTPYVSSPLLYDDRIYVTRGLAGNLSCYDARTGEPIYVREKIEGLKQIYASPIGVAGRIYIADRKGTTVVLEHSDTINVLAINVLDDGFDASPVVIGDELYLKGRTNLYCITRKGK